MSSATILDDREPREKSGLDSKATTSMDFNIEQIVDMVLKKMGQVTPTFDEQLHLQSILPEQLEQ